MFALFMHFVCFAVASELALAYIISLTSKIRMMKLKRADVFCDSQGLGSSVNICLIVRLNRPEGQTLHTEPWTSAPSTGACQVHLRQLPAS